MFRTILATEAPLDGAVIRAELQEAGIDIVAVSDDPAGLASIAVRHDAELVIAASNSPSPSLFEAARQLATLAPCPFVVFTSDGATEKIEQASAAGVHAYVVDGYAKYRLLSVVRVAHARFQREQRVREELTGLSKRFEERKVVDRAKGVLMRSRGITEDTAFEMLRSVAMRARQRIGVVSQSVIDLSRAGEAVNRAGQLRMLSQRLVFAYAQSLSGVTGGDPARIVAECIDRVGANLDILNKAITTRGYGELVARVAGAWSAMLPICEAPPQAARLAELDGLASRMRDDADSLTGFLESSGLVASLHVINVAGRQRMLGQAIAKLCLMHATEARPEQLVELRTLAAEFSAALDYLRSVPLWTPELRDNLDRAIAQWQRLRIAVDRIESGTALVDMVDSSERLLEACERMTDGYEQAMQILVGDRLGQMR